MDDPIIVPVPRTPPVIQKPSSLPTILIYAMLVIVVVGGMWWALTRKPDTAAQVPTEENAHAAPRPPAPSVPQHPAPAPLKEPAPAVAPILFKDSGPIIAEESFTYREGQNIKGKAGGKGWDAPWQGLEGKIESGSLSYLNHPASGGTLLIPGQGPPVVLTRPVGPSARFIPDPAKGGHWYIGLLIHHMSSSPAPGGEILINPISLGDVNNIIHVSVGEKSGVLQIGLNDDAHKVEMPQDGKPLYLILRIDLKNPMAGKYDIKGTLWINPDLGSAKPDKTGQRLEVKLKSQSVPQQFGLHLRKRIGKSDTRIDEVRFAPRMSDMVFKPVAEEEEVGP
jgi:hypothetical protein